MFGVGRNHRLLRGALFASTAIWAAAMALLGAPDALMYLGPALLVALPLAFGLYAGETVLVEAIRRVRPRPRRRAIAGIGRNRGPARLMPGGGLLLASNLAERGPPASAVFI